MKFTSHKHNFEVLKSKVQISFWVNLLVGLIFSFPVLAASAGNSGYLLSNDKSAAAITIMESCQDGLVFVKGLNAEEPLKLASSKTEKKSSVTGSNNGKSKYISVKHDNRKSENLILFPEHASSNSTFVDLSFLKELRTIRMLC